MVLKHEYGELYYHKIDGKWYIESIYVNPKHRNEGVGSWLMNVAIRRCGRPILLYATNEMGSNLKRLKGFYERFGFESVKQPRHNTYPYKYNMILEKWPNPVK